MGYTFKKPACTTGPKHKWEFVRNGVKSTVVGGSFGGSASFAVRGLYKCACGQMRIGAANMNAAGSDLREHMPA